MNQEVQELGIKEYILKKERITNEKSEHYLIYEHDSYSGKFYKLFKSNVLLAVLRKFFVKYSDEGFKYFRGQDTSDLPIPSLFRKDAIGIIQNKKEKKYFSWCNK